MQNGTLVVFATGNDGNLYLQWQNASGWSGWGSLGTGGGGFVDEPAAMMDNGTLLFFATADDGNIYFKWQISGGWSGWVELASAGGGFSLRLPFSCRAQRLSYSP